MGLEDPVESPESIDEEKLFFLEGAFSDGFAFENVTMLSPQLETVIGHSLVALWDEIDHDGPGGDVSLFLHDNRGFYEIPEELEAMLIGWEPTSMKKILDELTNLPPAVKDIPDTIQYDKYNFYADAGA